jgi:sugar phosphate isomerase/epimerase
MNFQRREFLKLTGAGAIGLALPSFAEAAGKKKVKEFGIQLYGIRDLMGKDPKGTLAKVAAAGYKYIEPFDHSELGMFFGMGNKGLKSYVNDLGMKIYSVHTNIYKDFEKKVEETAAIGIKYFIYNWEGPGKKLDDYKKMADDFNIKGEYCKKHGLQFAFHNHDFTFIEMDGVIPQEWLLDHTDKNLVDYQVDFYWVIYPGKDPVAHINKYADRYKLCHFKDRSKTSAEREKNGIVELGTGSIDFPSILKGLKKSRLKYFIVDQDTCNDREDPLACIKTDAEYMKNLRW